LRNPVLLHVSLDGLLQSRIDLGLLRQRLLHKGNPRLIDAFPFCLPIGLQLLESDPLLFLMSLLLLSLLFDLGAHFFLSQFSLSLYIIQDTYPPSFQNKTSRVSGPSARFPNR